MSPDHSKESMTPFETKREQILEEIERILTYLRAMPALPPNKAPYVWVGQPYRESIATVVKDADEWLSLAGSQNAFESKHWLKLQLAGDHVGAESWPTDDLIRDLEFIKKKLLATPLPDLKDVSISKEPSRTAPQEAGKPHPAEMIIPSGPFNAETDQSRLAELDPALHKTEPNKISIQIPVLPNEGKKRGKPGPTPEQVRAAEVLVDQETDVDVQHAAWYLRCSKKHVLRLISQNALIASNTRPKRITSDSLKTYKWRQASEENLRSDET